MNKRIKIAILTIVIVILLLSVCVWFIFPKGKPKNNVYFIVEIIAGHNQSYSVYAPVPLNSDGSIFQLVNSLHFEEGTGDYRLFETTHGSAIEINATGNIVLSGNQVLSNNDYEVRGFSRLSMWEYTQQQNKSINGFPVIGKIGVKTNMTLPGNNIAIKITHGHRSENGTSAVVDNVKSMLSGGWVLLDVYQIKAMESL